MLTETKFCEPPMDTLSAGLQQLCAADEETEALIKPRFSEITAALFTYIEEIERFNAAYGLVKVANRDELVVKHILDSLAPIAHIYKPLSGTARDSSVADAGSGAGLPGIPLAICLPGTRFTLIERMGRRAGFLRNVLAVLGLSNCTVEETEIEKAALDEPGEHSEHRESGEPCELKEPGATGRFDTICFRAFHPLTPELLKRLFRLLAPGGRLAAYKGRKNRTEEEMAAAGLESGSWELIPLSVPFLNEERHLAIVPLPPGPIPGQPACDTVDV